MTVMNTSYSTLEEAWGGDIAGRPTRKNDQNNKKKKPINDPICDLYNSKVSSSSYNETDLVRFANEYYDKFEKSKYQRNVKTLPLSYEEVEREPSSKNLTISKGESRYDLSNKRQEEYPLFQKQFEMKLPPLYDGGECPQIIQEDARPQRYADTKPVSGYAYAEWEERPTCKPRNRVKAESNESNIIRSEDVYSEGNTDRYKTEQEGIDVDYYDSITQERCNPSDEIYQEEHRNSDSYIGSKTDSYNGGRTYYDKTCDDSTYRDRDEKPYKYMGRFREDYDDNIIDDERRNKFFDDFNDPNNFQSLSKKKFSDLQFLDLILYVISGIILIFLLEQFVRIGINISR